MNNLTEDLKSMITSTITSTMCQIKNYKSLLYQNDSPKSEAPNIVVSGNSITPPLNSGHLQKLVACGISNMRSAHKNSMNS